MSKRACFTGVLGILFFVATVSGQQTSNPPASSDQPAAAQADKPAATATDSSTAPAHLHVYRQRRFAGSALAPSIYVDDKQVVRIGNGRRASIRLSPGPHSIRSDDKSSAITLDAKAGQDYFIRVDEATGFWKGHGKLTLLLPEQGSAEYKLQKPVEEDRKFAKDMIENDSEAAVANEEAKPEKK
jgi:hypothetical protein